MIEVNQLSNMAECVAEGSLRGEETVVCKLCLKDVAKYTCPRCNIRYCSSACYKYAAHADCSESFYKECFMEGLKDLQTTPDEKVKVMEMLQRLEDQDAAPDSDDDDDEEEEEEEDDEADLAERIDGLNLDTDTEKIWHRLTVTEKQEFEQMLQDGRLGNLVELWQPWWKQQKPLIEEVGEEKASSSLGHPGLKHDIPDLSLLLRSGTPSPCLPYTVVNVVYAYAFVARIYNGDHLNLAPQAAQDIMDVSNGLTNATYQSSSEALHCCLRCIQEKKKSANVSRDYAVAVIEDVKCILQGSHQRDPLTYTLAALSDAHCVLSKGRKKISKDIKQIQQKKRTVPASLEQHKKSYFSATKKIEFLLSWCQKSGLQLQQLIPEVEMEFCVLSTELASHKEKCAKLESAWSGKRPPKMSRFIEEVTDR